jgi:hypothetical protein
MDMERLVELELAGETKILRDNQFQCHIVHKSPTWSVIERGPSQWEVGNLTAWATTWLNKTKGLTNIRSGNSEILSVDTNRQFYPILEDYNLPRCVAV